MPIGVESADDIENGIPFHAGQKTQREIALRLQIATLKRLESIDETLLELGAKILDALPKESE